MGFVNPLKENFINIINMYPRIRNTFETFTQQALNWEAGAVYIPLAFGLLVGLVYVVISASQGKKGNIRFILRPHPGQKAF